MKTELRIAQHASIPSENMIELWHDGRFIGAVYGADRPGVRVISKYAKEGSFQPAMIYEVHIDPDKIEAEDAPFKPVPPNESQRSKLQAALQKEYGGSKPLEPMPPWAISKNAKHELLVGAQLCTRDGRKVGNAFILEIDRTGIAAKYCCRSDRGNSMELLETEVHSLFWIGDYIADVIEVHGRLEVV